MHNFSQGNVSRLINFAIWEYFLTVTFLRLFLSAVSQVWVYTTCLHSTKMKDHIMEGIELWCLIAASSTSDSNYSNLLNDMEVIWNLYSMDTKLQPSYQLSLKLFTSLSSSLSVA
jgi:hypothetical protein